VSKLSIPLIKLFGATLLLNRCVEILAFSVACAYTDVSELHITVMELGFIVSPCLF